jgi:hypothetical protein
MPIGKERVCFNAHRVFSHRTVVQLFSDLRLQSFSLVDDRGAFHPDAPAPQADACDYGCGMFHFRKPGALPASASR